MAKKGVIFPQEPWADVAGRGIRADATWNVRPRGSAKQIHASACMAWRWCGCVAGPRESTQTPGRCLRGERVTWLASDRLTKRSMRSFKHTNIGQKNFIIPNSQ